MKLAIITGASRGIGRELALELDRRWGRNARFILVARSRNALAALKAGMQGETVLCATDLANPVAATETFTAALHALDVSAYGHVYLVHNAGLAGPVGRLGLLDGKSVDDTMRVNITSPILLTNAIFQWIGDRGTQFSMLNISSGAARFPIEGLTAYCASKAGLDMLARVAGAEANPDWRFVSVAPGIIETDMQRYIRSVPADRFPMHDQFVAFKENGQLKTAEQSARELADILEETGRGDVIRSL